MSSQKETDWAWAAGFFDGEGSTSIKQVHRHRSDDTNITYKYVFIQMTNTDIGLLNRFKEIANAGSIVSNDMDPVTHPNCKPRWHYSIWNKEIIAHVIQHMWPYLGEFKRHQALNAIQACSDNHIDPVRNGRRKKREMRAEMKQSTRDELRKIRDERDQGIKDDKAKRNATLVKKTKRVIERDGLQMQQAAEGINWSRMQLTEIFKNFGEDKTKEET